MAVRKFTNIFVLLLILMAGSPILYIIPRLLHIKKLRTDRQWLLPNVNRQKMSSPIIKPVKKYININGKRGDLFDTNAPRNCPIHKCVN